MNDVAQLTIRPAAEDDAERLAALLTDEGYPAGPSDLERRIRGFAGPAHRCSSRSRRARCWASSRSRSCRGSRPRTGSSGSSPSSSTPARASADRQALLADVERVGRDEGVAFLEVTAGTTGPTRATCSSPWATTPPSRRTSASGPDGRSSPAIPPMTFPRLRLRDEVAGAARPAVGAAARRSGRRPATRSASCRSARRGTSSGSSSPTASCTR